MLGTPVSCNRKSETMISRNRIRFLIRMVVYITVVVLLYQNRGGFHWQQMLDTVRGSKKNDTSLTLAGGDLAPDLIDRLVVHYRQDYPDLEISVSAGGTNKALEDLLNGRAGAAFTFRRPSPDEENLFRSIDGDTSIVVPVALAGIALIAGKAAGKDPITLDGIRRLLDGDAAGRCDRLYAPDPNEGLLDAVRASLDLSGPSPAAPLIIYLADAPSVLEAVRRDDRAWGIVSSLNVPLNLDTIVEGVHLVPLNAGPNNESVLPTYENVATGDYPLNHYLFLVCRENGNRQGGKFLTHLATPRGLRQVERAGIVPAKLVLREINLTTTPVGQ
jgi:ABC-type phosphate transport system substrate-binding protein